MISGLLAALGGLVTTAVVTEANPSASPAIIFNALTAVALAGVALTGGRGSLPRVLVGALILATIANGLTIRGIQPYWATVFTGALLLGLRSRCRAGHPDQRLRAPDGDREPVRPPRRLRHDGTDGATTPGRRPRAARHRPALRLRPRAGRHRLPRHARRGGRPARRQRRRQVHAAQGDVRRAPALGGTIRVRGEEVAFHAPSDSAAAGIQMVYQDLALVEPQDISTNLNIGPRDPARRSAGLARLRRPQGDAQAVGGRARPARRAHRPDDPRGRDALRRPAPGRGPARSAIRVTGESHGVLLLDEPTAALGYEQTKQVEALIRRMADQGIAIVLVTHNLPLCYEVADRVVILNRGRKVADVPMAETETDHVVGWITGARPSKFAA